MPSSKAKGSMPVRRAVGVAPDLAAHRLEAVEASFGERRGGEQRRRDRLQRQRDAQLLDHVGFVGEVEVHLDRRRAVHHVEAARADRRHVARHDASSAPSACAVSRPASTWARSRARGSRCRAARRRSAPRAGAGASPPPSRAASRRGAGKLELAARLEADVAAQLAIRPLQRDDLVALDDRLPAEAGDQRLQQRARCCARPRRGPASG